MRRRYPLKEMAVLLAFEAAATTGYIALLAS